ncbi:MAG TPA: hypothetical protein VI756_24450, partial [Blastocatellia bacterium]
QKFLGEFTTKHNISLLVDLANGKESNVIVWADARADVSDVFVREYNAAFPVAGAQAAPKP